MKSSVNMVNKYNSDKTQLVLLKEIIDNAPKR